MGAVTESGGIEVRSVTLDGVIGTAGAPPPTFIKMDIEGGEHAALSGAAEMLRISHPTILLSEHGWRQHELCTGLLERLGYEIEVLLDGSSDGNYVVLAMHVRSGILPVASPPVQ